MNLRLQIFIGQLAWLVAVLKGCDGKSLHGVPGVGRNLLVRAFPAVEDVQSNVYEVQMGPYFYDFERAQYPVSGERTQKQIDLHGRHGGPRDHVRHVGDLGNVKAEEGEPLAVRLVDHLISLAGPRSVVGRSLAISRGEDDYGRAGTEDSALTGTSGPPVACGIIGYLN